ncbi:MAG: hypothetical protein NC453_20090 [Muribaculum sp.]|nr:hypothetical protein [Muribaculum sp.]
MSVKKYLTRIISKLSPSLFFRIAYFHNRKRWPNLKNPSDLSEHAIWRVLNNKVNNIYYLADKYAVREYVEKKGLKNILTPLIAVYEEAGQINLDKLPQRFALKANFGAGMNFICSDKSDADENKIRELVNGWLTKPQIYSNAESHYNLIKHKIICEEYIDDGTGGFPTDYKFLCIKGKARCVLACNGRESAHAHYAHYDMDWNFIPEYDKLHRAAGCIPKPLNFDEMVKVAEKLAEDIELVRVDLYSNGNRIWFGEMTLTPAGCIFHGWSDMAIKEFGKYFND